MERTKLGLGVFGAALVLGVLGDGLLRTTPWGTNALLLVTALILSAVVLARLGSIRLRDGAWWLAPLALLFASFIAWRAAPVLVFLNISMTLAALSLAAVRGRQGSLKLSGISEYVLGGLYTGLCAVAGPIPVALKDVEWREVAQGRWRPALAVTRGLLVAVPLFFIFGSLFSAADAVFEGMVRDVFDFRLGNLSGHLLRAGFLAWISAGLLRLFFLGREPDWTSPGSPKSLTLGTLEFGIVLGLLNVLFLSFVAIQVGYLFGGLGEISASGSTYAEYARRGFFELTAVTALVLPLLLLAHWLFRPENRFHERIFKALAGSLLMLLLIITASALYRMWLYLQEFGLTELRFYTTAFMVWLTLILAWFAVTVLLRGRRNRFAYGTLLSGLAVVVLLNIVNPDAIIARVNVNRLEEGERFDPYYLTTLSPDAAPVLVAALPRIGDEPLYEDEMLQESDEESPTIRKTILDSYNSQVSSDWRTWNLSRYRAKKLARSTTESPATLENPEAASR